MKKTKITDLSALQGKHLKYLNISECPIADLNFFEEHDDHRMEFLIANDCATEKFLEKLFASNLKIDVLALEGNISLTGESFLGLKKNKIKIIKLNGCRNISQVAIKSIKKLNIKITQ